MASFSFLHAADLHLDSPLIGLSGRAPDFAARVEDASRTALDALVQLAIDEGCRFVLLAGDVFDGDLRNIRAGLFLVSRLARLRDAGIPVYMILGNHDAENRFVAKLDFSDNVTLFSARAAHTARLPELDVAIHGRSFFQRDVTENLAQSYPAPVSGAFNIGLLHTACLGHEGEHAAYAPCSVQQLVNHGYDYWALGHIHDRGLLNERPYVLYPGNLQGRSARETGAKGATLVRVRDGAVESLEHRTLDAVRWAHERVELGGAARAEDVPPRLRAAMERAGAASEGRPLALRLTLTGETPLHGELALRKAELREEAETLAAGLAADVWLEKLSLATRPPQAVDAGPDPTVAGRIQAEIAALPADQLAERLEVRIAEIRARLPASARADALVEALRAEAPARARALAQALVGAGSDDALR